MPTLREIVLGLLFTEKKQPEPRIDPASAPVATPVASENTELNSHPAVTAPARDGNHCPQCSSSLWRPFCSGVRCAQCGFQQDAVQAIGVSRREYESGVYRGTKAVINSGAFMQARGRLLGR